MTDIPHIVKDERGIPTLYVHGRPFFATAGELHNSAGSCLNYMDAEVWPNLHGMNMNTVVVPLYWEQIEPERGKYDFHIIDGLVEQARREGMHLVGLWFGLWKNAESMYVPSWVKTDSETFPRIQTVSGESLNTISPQCQAAVDADAAAFAAVMKHIRSIDEEENTFIFMQVENEIGVLGSDRDYSDAADAAFAGDVPVEVSERLHVQGTWSEAFGETAAENFMAYHFAKAVEQIAEAGQAEYPLPMYANAWLKQYPWYPGSYPSGGAVDTTMAMWKAIAPALFTIAPDIYVPSIAQTMDEYGSVDNPLFVPEVRKDAQTASYCLYAFMRHNAIGYSPFGIEELALPPESIQKPPMEVMIALNIDPSAFDITNSKEYLSRTYKLVHDLEPLMLKYRGTDALRSWVRTADVDSGAFLRLSDYDVQIAYAPKGQSQPLGAGAIFEIAPNKFVIVGMMSTLTFRAKPDENKKVDVVSYQEGDFVDGVWQPRRTLNGDEKMSIGFGPMPEVRVLELFKY